MRRDLRSPRTPTAISSNPAASVASHGADPAAARGAMPPKPVAAPPIGALELPTASVRLSTFSPEALSSTTMVWTEPAASLTDMAVCWPDALNFTVWVPGWTLMYDVTAPKASCRARTSPP